MLDAREHVEVLTMPIKRPDSCGPTGIEGNITPMRDLLGIEAPKPRSAVWGIAAGVPWLQLPVEPDEVKLLLIFPDQRAFAGSRIDQKHIMPAGVPIVEVYGYFVRGDMRPIRRYRARVSEGRQITEFGIAGINHEQMQIFIPILIVQKHDVTTIWGPVLPVNRPALGARDWLPC